MRSALFFDVDGTLVDSYHGVPTISPAVRAELARVRERGHGIFLSSGRPRNLLTPHILAPGFDGFVLINGGYVEMDGASVFEERMDPDLAHRSAALLDDLGYEYLLVTAPRSYTRPTNQQVIDFFSRIHTDIFDFEYDLEEVLSRTIKLEAIVPVEERPYVTERAAEVLGPQISCDSHGGEGTFELYPTAISKAKGIGIVLERLGMDVSQAYAFGDGTNDMEMMEFCGHSVAMGNAEDVVKAAADIVCPPVWEDGLAVALRELF